MINFCETDNLSNLIKEPTCFKNPHNPSAIDLILTNRPRSSQKPAPITIAYRDDKNFIQPLFRNELLKARLIMKHLKTLLLEY